jgi:polyisoprenoid-binding protein YceI
MKNFVLKLLAIVLLFSACKQHNGTSVTESNTDSVQQSINYKDGSRQANRLFPDKLRNLPNEIIAAHYPNPCYATYEDSMYIWKHNTTIQTKEDLQIVEYGSFVYTEKGWYLRVTMSAKDFEEYYNCKGGLLKKGVIYTDNASWRRGKKLIAGDAMWYYIAKNKNGRLIKGMAPIETEAKLINSTSTTAIITQSNINWTGYGEIGGYSLTGNIQLKNGDIQMQGDTLKSAAIKIDMASITHKDKTLETHLKSEDFFDVKKYPEATFETETIEYTNANTAIAKGRLTIKQVTRPIKIALTIEKTDISKILKAVITIDRTLFGIKYNSKSFFGGLGDRAIKNNFDLSFNLAIK